MCFNLLGKQRRWEEKHLPYTIHTAATNYWYDWFSPSYVTQMLTCQVTCHVCWVIITSYIDWSSLPDVYHLTFLIWYLSSKHSFMFETWKFKYWWIFILLDENLQILPIGLIITHSHLFYSPKRYTVKGIVCKQ